MRFPDKFCKPDPMQKSLERSLEKSLEKSLELRFPKDFPKTYLDDEEGSKLLSGGLSEVGEIVKQGDIYY